MRALDFVKHSIYPAKFNSSIQSIELLFDEFQIDCIPVVKDEYFIGLLDKKTTKESEDTALINESLLSSSVKSSYNAHLYDLLVLIKHTNTETVIIEDEDMKFIGIAFSKDIIKYFLESNNFSVDGAIIVLEMSESDYNISEVCKSIEMNGVKILGIETWTTQKKEGNTIEASIKLNVKKVDQITILLEKKGFNISKVYNAIDSMSENAERYQFLLKYLNN